MIRAVGQDIGSLWIQIFTHLSRPVGMLGDKCNFRDYLAIPSG